MKRKLHRYSLILLVVAIVLGAWGEISRVLARDELRKASSESTILTVTTITPTHNDLGEELVLPGSVQAYIEAPIYARTSGYLKRWYTDIGAHVRKGDLLADIETPEVDQQLNQAQADLATAKANQALAESTNERWKILLATESVSRQDADEKAGDAAAKKAAAESAAANVARLRDLESFKRVVAPFDGIVTARNTDVGALINAGQLPGSELFHVADMQKLRIYVQVPEAYSSQTKPGLEAALHFAEFPRNAFTAKVVYTANALDPVTRTLQVQLQLDNGLNQLFPGAYAEVHFKLPGNAQTLRIPSNTIIFRSAGLQVATVDADKRVRLKSIVQGRDLGATIEVLSGIDVTDIIVLNPPDSIVDGTPLRIVAKST
ncbi:MAG: efflux RND transporter periplasmic adaptor subunit [Steroidobacterales bacterium]